MRPETYVKRVQALLAPLADPARARAMRAYLRDRHPFLGLPAPLRRQALAGMARQRFEPDDLRRIALALWALPEREYRYTAVDLLARHARRLSAGDVDWLIALARRDAWWETVDGLAGVIGDVLAQARRQDADAQTAMDAALRDDDFWVRRIAMIHQLGWRRETDEARLFAYADALAAEGEFFIRKAIGWALRDYGYWAPDAVRRYLAAQGDRLSALSRREAGRSLPEGRAGPSA